MKPHARKQYAGVWLDSTKAYIIAKNPAWENAEYAIQDTIKAQTHHGSGSEHSNNHSKQSEELQYLKALAAQLHSYDELLLIGPGQSQEQLINHLKEDAQFNDKKISIDTAEQMSDGQMIAQVREFFAGRQS